MQAPTWTDFLRCSICTNKFDQSDVVPISLSCGHTLCTRCLGKLKTRTCPYDKASIRPDAESLPPNAALLQLLGYPATAPPLDNPEVMKLTEPEREQYLCAMTAIGELASFLQPLAEHGITAAVTHLTKPMLKKLVTVVNCQVLDPEGQARALRSARSIADRTVTELLVMHQNQQQISTLLWTAIRNRGCQFLGPVMQEEALKLILRVLETGNSLSRKNIVLFVVQRLSSDFPQASKTSVGHVVQLLYRASCFNVEKRDDDSSLMQLKEEFRTYEALRREHDGQIVRMAMEAGLRIGPEQWSTLLYSDHKHKSEMQSIIDKLISQGAASSGLNELIVAIGRSQDPYQLSEKVVPHLEAILKVRVNPDKTGSEVVEWDVFATVMEALLATLQGFSTFMQIQSGRFKTGMCPHFGKPEGCPKGENCTYAHSEEERDRFRNMVKPAKISKPRSGEQFSRGASLGRATVSGLGGRNVGYPGDHTQVKPHDGTPHSSLSSLELIQSAPNSLHDQQAYSDLIRYQQHSGEQMRLRHSGPITAPVLPTHEWTAVPRGVATVDHTYRSAENGMTSYISADQLYHKSLPREGLGGYSVNPPLSNIDLNMIRLQHKAVNQSLEASRDLTRLGGPYPQGEWLQGSLLPPTAEPQPSAYSMPTSNPFSIPSDELLSSGSLTDDVPPALNTSGQQQLISSMEQLQLSGPNNSGNSSSSNSGNIPASYSSGGGVQPTSTTFPQLVSSSPAHSVPYPNITSDVSHGSVTTHPVSTTTASTGAPTSSQQELQAEILRLKEQLKEQQQTIHQQKVQLQYGGNIQPSQGISARQAPAVQFPAPQQQIYGGVNGLIVGEEPSRHHHHHHHQTAPVVQPQSYSGPIQYSTQQIQAAMAALVTPPPPQPSTGYYSQTSPSNYQQSQWSGPQQSSYTVAPPSGTSITPPATGYIMQASQVVLPSTANQPSQPTIDLSDDEMLAAYIQMMEQNKAAAAASAPGYQTAPSYNPPQGQYYYHRQ